MTLVQTATVAAIKLREGGPFNDHGLYPHARADGVYFGDTRLLWRDGAGYVIRYPETRITSKEASTRTLMNAMLRGVGLGNNYYFQLKAKEITKIETPWVDANGKQRVYRGINFGLDNSFLIFCSRPGAHYHWRYTKIERGEAIPLACTEMAHMATLAVWDTARGATFRLNKTF